VTGALPVQAHFDAAVAEGYQASLTWHQGAHRAARGVACACASGVHACPPLDAHEQKFAAHADKRQPLAAAIERRCSEPEPARDRQCSRACTRSEQAAAASPCSAPCVRRARVRRQAGSAGHAQGRWWRARRARPATCPPRSAARAGRSPCGPSAAGAPRASGSGRPLAGSPRCPCSSPTGRRAAPDAPGGGGGGGPARPHPPTVGAAGRAPPGRYRHAVRCGGAPAGELSARGAGRADTDGAGARQRLGRVGRAAVRLCGRARVLREELGRRLPQPLVLGAVRGVRGRAGCRADLRGCARPAARAGPGTPGWPQQCLRCFSWATLLKLLLPCHATAAMEFMSPVRRAMSAECV